MRNGSPLKVFFDGKGGRVVGGERQWRGWDRINTLFRPLRRGTGLSNDGKEEDAEGKSKREREPIGARECTVEKNNTGREGLMTTKVRGVNRNA